MIFATTSGVKRVPRGVGRLIHRSAWKGNSAHFAFIAFSEVRCNKQKIMRCDEHSSAAWRHSFRIEKWRVRSVCCTVMYVQEFASYMRSAATIRNLAVGYA